ncbi:MAG: coproporphyrinogen dehydrogenase HemZ [Syntrophomonadaceae bacterium]|nr:coproporphyrinogen dehydrogenase HemZ [Syntrophomonadaceae bacterium]
MIISCNLEPPRIYASIHELIRMAYPDADIYREYNNECEIEIKLRLAEHAGQYLLEGSIASGYKTSLLSQTRSEESLGFEQGNTRRFLQRFTYRLLATHLERDFNAYGILTGVRPVKLVHGFLDQDYTREAIQIKLENEYLMNPGKARLLLEVAQNNRPFLLEPAAAKKMISVYIGIPYCPSRCYYCSFPGAVMKDYEREAGPFLTALFREMKELGEFAKSNGLAVQSIYLGGGTPTVLSAGDLQRVFELLHHYYISAACEEISVEAGRPDTLSLQKLKLLRDAGVSRVCINPQSMNDATLKRIGRNHDSKGVMQSVGWAREAGIKQINMDLIVGLPGESIREVTYTAEEILKINPENITVHTLAVKRGSVMAELEGKSNVHSRIQEVEEALNQLSAMFREQAYIPYYLYRQKYMKASMENTAYARPDSFCLYNIQMMEERQSIIGMGGGASSKFVNVSNGSLSSFHNPKNPQSYCQSIERLIKGKVDKLRALN